MKLSYQGWSNISSYTYPSGNFQTLGSNWRWLWPLKSILLETNLHLLEHQKVLRGGFEKVGQIRPPQYVPEPLQSRPIEMRATILYLASPWTEFEMLLTPLRFLYLVMFSLLAFSSILQSIAHFQQITLEFFL